MKDHPDKKVKTKDDLIRFIQSLPDGYLPTKCIWWHEPIMTAMLEDGGSETEVKPRIEIEILGPTYKQVWEGKKL